MAGSGNDLSVLHDSFPHVARVVRFASERKGCPWGPRSAPPLWGFSKGTRHTSGT